MGMLQQPCMAKGNKGFSLVELMIVVAIIGILAALAVPKFQNFQAKAKQAEAKSNVSHIYTLEQSYFGDFDTFSGSLVNIGFSPNGHVRYNYSVPAASAAAFTADAVSPVAAAILNSCTTPDHWTMNETKTLMAVFDCVTGGPHAN